MLRWGIVDLSEEQTAGLSLLVEFCVWPLDVRLEERFLALPRKNSAADSRNPVLETVL